MNLTENKYFGKRARENLSDAVSKTYNYLKYPAIYTISNTLLSGIMEATKCAITEDVSKSFDRGIDTMDANHIMMYGTTNLVYGRTINFLTKKIGKASAWGFYAAVNLGQYTYLSITQDADPTIQCTFIALVGAFLTNKQIKEITKNNI